MKRNLDDLVQEVYFSEDSYYTYDKFTNEQLQIILDNQREQINYLNLQLSEYKRFILLFTFVSFLLLIVINYLG
jgi:hypothetical protein